MLLIAPAGAGETSQLENAERVELHVEGGIFTVIVHSVDKGEDSCDDGKIRMCHLIADGLGATRIRVVLSRTLGGTLVVEDAARGSMRSFEQTEAADNTPSIHR